MAIVGLNRFDNQMDTPGMSEYITKDITSKIEAGEVSIKENWKNVEKEPCPKCKGSGYDLEEKMSCIACDGTGIDYEIHYGVQDGVAYARVIQNGMEAILEYCKAKRESETSDWKKDNALGLAAFALPNSARCELIAQGYPVEDWENSGDMRSYARAVRKHFPLFMTTNVII